MNQCLHSIVQLNLYCWYWLLLQIDAQDKQWFDPIGFFSEDKERFKGDIVVDREAAGTADTFQWTHLLYAHPSLWQMRMIRWYNKMQAAATPTLISSASSWLTANATNRVQPTVISMHSSLTLHITTRAKSCLGVSAVSTHFHKRTFSVFFSYLHKMNASSIEVLQ